MLLSPMEFSATAPQALTTNESSTENKIEPSAWHSYTSKQLKEICNHVKPTNLISLPFGTMTTICELRLNNRTRKNRNRNSRKTAQDRMNKWNLRKIGTLHEDSDEIVKNIRLSTVNARLIKKQRKLISDVLTNRKIDILIATKTWLQESEQDET